MLSSVGDPAKRQNAVIDLLPYLNDGERQQALRWLNDPQQSPRLSELSNWAKRLANREHPELALALIDEITDQHSSAGELSQVLSVLSSPWKEKAIETIWQTRRHNSWSGRARRRYAVFARKPAPRGAE